MRDNRNRRRSRRKFLMKDRDSEISSEEMITFDRGYECRVSVLGKFVNARLVRVVSNGVEMTSSENSPSEDNDSSGN